MVSSRRRLAEGLSIAIAIGIIGPVAAAPAQNCAPVEVAPGVKQAPRGCPAGQKKPAKTRSDAKSTRDAHQFKIGDTEFRIGGRVRTEYGFQR